MFRVRIQQLCELLRNYFSRLLDPCGIEGQQGFDAEAVETGPVGELMKGQRGCGYSKQAFCDELRGILLRAACRRCLGAWYRLRSPLAQTVQRRSFLNSLHGAGCGPLGRG